MTQTFVFTRELNRLDALHYYLGERKDVNVAMMMIAVLDRELPAATIREGFSTAACEIPRFKDRLRRVPGDLAAPVWEPTPAFDIAQHVAVAKLPPASTWAAVLTHADDMQSSGFPDGLPPWSVLYLTGAPNGRSVVALKIHHSLSDATALSLMLGKVFMREVFDRVGAEEITAQRGPPPKATVVEALSEWRRSLGYFVHVLREAAPKVIGSSHDRAFHRGELRDFADGSRRWSNRRSRQRRSALFSLPLKTWREAARQRGGSVNDLYLAVAAATLGRYLPTRPANRPLRVVMPIDIRDATSTQDGGNLTGAGMLELTGSDEDLADLGAINQASVRAQECSNSVPPSIIDGALALFPGGIQHRALLRLFSTKDLLATNVRIPFPCGLGAAKAEHVFLLAPAIGTPVSFALAGYENSLGFGVNIDLGLIKHPDRLEAIVYELLRDIGGTDMAVVTRMVNDGKT